MAGRDLKEQLLIARVRQQDRRAADKLIRRYYNEIYAYVFRQTGDKERAMDLTQDIFLAVLQSIIRYDPKKAAFRTWLYRIASHKVVDWFRSGDYQSRQQWVPLENLEFEPKSGEDVEKQVTDQDFVRHVFAWLAMQDGALEEIFRLKFFGDATFDEIGEILELPSATVKTRYYAAIKAARKEFAR